jgi:hypothetical protein
MTAARHWADFPPSLFTMAERLALSPKGRLTMDNVTKADAYNIRNEYHRFRRAICRSFHGGEESSILRELYEIVRDATLQVVLIDADKDIYQLSLGRPAISARVDQWRDADEVLSPTPSDDPRGVWERLIGIGAKPVPDAGTSTDGLD